MVQNVQAFKAFKLVLVEGITSGVRPTKEVRQAVRSLQFRMNQEYTALWLSDGFEGETCFSGQGAIGAIGAPVKRASKREELLIPAWIGNRIFLTDSIGTAKAYLTSLTCTTPAANIHCELACGTTMEH
eukprot:1185062-Prorocentrum_minimum.AAC.3